MHKVWRHAVDEVMLRRYGGLEVWRHKGMKERKHHGLARESESQLSTRNGSRHRRDHWQQQGLAEGASIPHKMLGEWIGGWVSGLAETVVRAEIG